MKADIPEWGSPDFVALRAAADQQCARDNETIDWMIKGCHEVAKGIVMPPHPSPPYGVEAQCATYSIMLEVGIMEWTSHQDLASLLAAALTRLARLEKERDLDERS